MLRCELCGVENWVTNYDDKPLGGDHDWSEWQAIREESNGDILYRRTCKRCSFIDEKVENKVLICSHECDSYTSSTNSSNKEVKAGKCKKCGATIHTMSFFDYSSIEGTVSGDPTKLSPNASLTWRMPNITSGRTIIQLGVKMSLSTHVNQLLNPWDYKFSVHEGDNWFINSENSSLPDLTYQDTGLVTDELRYLNFLDFYLGSNCKEVEIVFEHIRASYRLMFGGEIRLITFNN
jgi:hypothetical protein